MTTRCHWMVLASVACVLATQPALGRTIILTDEDCEKMAFIQEATPRWSWAGYEIATGIHSTAQFYVYHDRAFLIRFPLERIPRGQRIVKAELQFTTGLQTPGEQRLSIRRLSQEWGPGVCWLYRMTRPKKLEWSKPGARAGGADRVARPSAVVRTLGMGDKVANVTEDVELWYSGAASNHGWCITLDDRDAYVILQSPLWSGRGNWKLNVTYEPE